MQRKRKRNEKIRNSLIIISILILFLLGIMIKHFKSIMPENMFSNSTYNIEYIQDIYHIEKASIQDIDKYLVRLDINNKIQELGVSNVIPFFNKYTKNSFVSVIIIKKAIEMKVPVNIAFSLVWQESKFVVNEISPKNRNGSRDWGLFQLNDTYYKWNRREFFNIKKNVTAGVTHLEYCLDEMGEMPLALAAYNVGVYGLRTNGMPISTKKHVNIILEYENQINQEFNKWLKSL